MKAGRAGLVAGGLVALLGFGVFWSATDGFTAFTAETARRAEILRSPRSLPAVALEDQDGRRFSLQDYRGRLLAVEFIYTRCTTICRSLGMAFRQVRERLPAQALGHEVALLSISFDAARDDPASLKAYGQAFGADGAHWRIARIHSPAEVAPLLAAFGVVVIPDGMGGFEHNAAIHLLGRDGKLTQISDIDQPVEFADRIASSL
ncbi:MAG: SCO family protein [Rhodocyclales bacterium]|nr:SCO family protein [Rhodocyclales bacterium]